MKRKWAEGIGMIGRFRAITLEGPEYELCLAGQFGEIWTNGNRLKAFKLNHGGSEKIFSFEYKDLQKWVTRLGVPASRSKQVEYANSR